MTTELPPLLPPLPPLTLEDIQRVIPDYQPLETSTTPIAQTLRGVLEKLTPPGKWTKGYYAKNTLGEFVSPTDKSATCWCIDGAIRAVLGPRFTWLPASEAIAKVIGEQVSTWQDDKERTHADVIGVLTRTIAAEEGQSS